MTAVVLGIETSCDETGIGIVRGRDLLANEIASSVDEHARFGGVVPEVASRAHVEAMLPTLDRACASAGVRPGDLDAIAVTSGPGLAGTLMVGVAAAKALSLALGIPLYGVNHLAAHIAVDILEHGPLPEPVLALLVSAMGLKVPTYNMVPVPPFAVPQVISISFWGGVWGIVFMALRNRLGTGSMFWIWSIVGGAIALSLVAWFVAAPLKGLPVAGGWVPARMMVDLNMQARNGSYSEFVLSPKGVHFVSFNNVPHLDDPARRQAITFA